MAYPIRTVLVLAAVLLGVVAVGARIATAKTTSTTPIQCAYDDTGRFVSPKKAHLTLTDCRQHKHRLALVYKGLAGLGPARASAAVVRTNVKVNANPAVPKMLGLSEQITFQGQPSRVVEAETRMLKLMYGDYVWIAKAEAIKPSSKDVFMQGDAHTIRRRINVDGLISLMRHQHCSMVARFKGVRYVDGIYRIVRWLFEARNTALVQAGQKPLAIPSAKAACR